jgi:hypothetical protein
MRSRWTGYAGLLPLHRFLEAEHWRDRHEQEAIARAKAEGKLEGIDREVTILRELVTELRKVEARRVEAPARVATSKFGRRWWRRWLGGGLLLGLLPAFPAHTQTSFEWALLCRQKVLHSIYDNDSDHEKLALEEYEGRENASDAVFIYRNGSLGRYITYAAEETDL